MKFYITGCSTCLVSCLWFAAAAMAAGKLADQPADQTALPQVPDGLEVTRFASEPLVRQPGSLAFDEREQVLAGTGPQHHNPSPETSVDHSDAVPTGSAPFNHGFAVERQQDRLLIKLNGNAIVDFVFRDDQIVRPYFANARLADGLQVTRHHPPTPGVDSLDHDTMHPGIWLGFGDINGHDFWRNGATIKHLRFVSEPQVADGRLSFATQCRLATNSGESVGLMTNDFKLVQRPSGWLLIWSATFHADHGPLVFGDQEEMGFAARVATPFTEQNGGIIRSSTGKTSAAETWGQPAMWCDYSGIGPNSGGIMLMASPNNFRESWWHNRDYGVFVATPFGRQAMQQGARSAITVAQDETLQVQFAALIHDPREFDRSTEYALFRDMKTGSLEPHSTRETGD